MRMNCIAFNTVRAAKFNTEQRELDMEEYILYSYIKFKIRKRHLWLQKSGEWWCLWGSRFWKGCQGSAGAQWYFISWSGSWLRKWICFVKSNQTRHLVIFRRLSMDITLQQNLTSRQELVSGWRQDSGWSCGPAAPVQRVGEGLVTESTGWRTTRTRFGISFWGSELRHNWKRDRWGQRSSQGPRHERPCKVKIRILVFILSLMGAISICNLGAKKFRRSKSRSGTVLLERGNSSEIAECSV